MALATTRYFILALGLLITSSPAQLIQIHTGAPGARIGAALARIGDIDGDFVDDYAIGFPLESGPFGAGAGAVRVYSGATRTVIRLLQGPNYGAGFGFAIASAGDVDGDGRPDVIVGAPSAWAPGTTSATGSAQVFSGATGALIHTFFGDSAGDRFGHAVASAGDFDADGYGDVIIGAPNDDVFGAGPERGSAFVYSGRTRAFTWAVNGTANFAHCGESVSAAGDQNNDGYDDVLVGIPGRDLVQLFSISTFPAVLIRDYTSPASGTRFGAVVKIVGDPDGDGRQNVAIGAPNAFGNAGRVEVWTGPTLLHSIAGTPGQLLGSAIDGGFDINGDYTQDFVVGAPGSGHVIAYNGSSGTPFSNWLGVAAQGFGAGLALIGDIDLDGQCETMIGAPLAAFGAGQVELYSTLPPAGRTPGRTWRFGAPCLDGLGHLSHARFVGTPAIGSTVQTTLSNAPPFQLAMALIGYGTGPVNLGVFGAPQCSLWMTNNIVTYGMRSTDAIGRATAGGFWLPPSPSLVGAAFTCQWATLAVAANLLGIVTSDAVGVVIGN